MAGAGLSRWGMPLSMPALWRGLRPMPGASSPPRAIHGVEFVNLYKEKKLFFFCKNHQKLLTKFFALVIILADDIGKLPWQGGEEKEWQGG